MTHALLLGAGLLLIAVAGIIVLNRILVRRSEPRFVQQLQAWRDDTRDLEIKPLDLPPLQPLKARRLTRLELIARSGRH